VQAASLQALRTKGYSFKYIDPGHDSLLCGIDDDFNVTDIESRNWRHRTHADAHQARRSRWDVGLVKISTTLYSANLDTLAAAVHERVNN